MHALNDVKGPFNGQERTTTRQDSRLLTTTSPLTASSLTVFVLRLPIQTPHYAGDAYWSSTQILRLDYTSCELYNKRHLTRLVSRRWFAPLSATIRPIFPRVDRYNESSGDYYHHPKVRTAAHSPTTPCQHARNWWLASQCASPNMY